MAARSFSEILGNSGARDPKPSIALGLSDGNRLSLDQWEILDDCVASRWPNGSVRFLIPFSSVVSVEITETK